MRGGGNTDPIAISFVAWTGAGDFDAGITNDGTTAPLSGALDVFTYDLAANGFSGETVESITFTSTDAGGVANGNDGFVVLGLSGVAVPEPATLALLGLGGFVLRRRRNS